MVKYLFHIFLFIPLFIFSQKKNDVFQYHISKSKSTITIDGIEEASWNQTQLASDFFMMLPNDTSKANVRTDVRMTYDAKNIYIIAICHHKVSQPYMVESLKRDFAFG